ncbi:hypothetical protein N0V90_011359 [Kalmusia sp. IMI 367209]|nr:hypothetical protein N0V90_011359 [Kalmusia sp. IMI 367209]
MKSVLAMEHGMIPATIGIQKFNPNIDFEATQVKVVTDMTPWPKSKLRRVSVNSFGFGGANGHVILDHPDVVAMEMARQNISRRTLTDSSQRESQYLDAESGLVTPPLSARSDTGDLDDQPGPRTRRLVLLPFSAHDREALVANIAALGEVVSSLPLADVAYTLSKHRSRLLYKSFAVADIAAVAEVISSPPTNIVKSAPTQQARVGFVFTGQGAQWKEMGRALFEYQVFESSIMAMDSVLASLSIAPSWSLKDVLIGTSERSVQEAEISQAVCAALQIAVVDLLRSWSIMPHVTVGHSSGEIAAAYASGRVSRSEAIILAYCRAKAITFNTRTGAMMAVGLSLDEANTVLNGLESHIKVAAVNSPRSVTLSGDADAVDQLHRKLQADGTFARLLQTDNNAYHSHHMLPIGERYEDMLKTYVSEIQSDFERLPQCTWVSSVTPGKEPSAKAAYWRENLEGAVLFAPAVEHLVAHRETQVDILVEIGPHSALQGPVKQIISTAASEHGVKAPVYLSALRRFEDNMQNMLSLCGSLFQLNADVDLIAVNSVEHGRNKAEYVHARQPRICVDLPTYQYSYGPVLYHENRITRELRARLNLHHDLLGLLRPGGSKDQPVWRNVLRIKDVPWLSDHRLIPNAVLPGAAYICLAIEAVSQHVRTQSDLSNPYFKLRNIQIKNALIIPDDDFGIEVMTSIAASSFSSNWFEFAVTSVDRDGTWSNHAKGLVTVVKSAVEGVAEVRRLDDKMDRRYIDVRRWYNKFEEIGLGYGKSFQGLSNLLTDPYKDIAMADVDFNPTAGMFTGPESSYAIHPATLDICFQASIIAAHGGQVGRVQHGHIPVFIEEISVWPPRVGDGFGQVIAHGQKRGLRNSLAQIQVFDQSGLPRVDVKNLKGVRYDGGKPLDSTPQSNEYTRLAWKPDFSTLSNSQAESVIINASSDEPHPRLAGLVDLMGHRDPSMRILQIGIDHAVSKIILRALGGHTDTLRYDTFALADRSNEVLREAELALSEFKNVTTRHFNLEQEDQAQNVEDGFDMVIVGGLDGIQDVPTMLLRLRLFTKIDARLILLGSTHASSEWSQALTVNAFSGVDIALDQGEQFAPILVSKALPVGYTAPTPSPMVCVYIVYQTTITAFHQALADEFSKRRIIPIVATLADADRIPKGSRVIMTMDLEGGLLDASEAEYDNIKALGRNVSSLLWLTKGDILEGHDPTAAIATGLVRTLITEIQESQFAVFHLEASSLVTASSAVGQICDHEARLHEGNPDLEAEVALYKGVIYTPRLVYDSGLSTRSQAANSHSISTVNLPIHSQGPVRVDFATPGLISSAYFRPDKSVKGPLPEDWIEIKTSTIGINWKDVIMASGRATSRMDLDSCSYECAGTVVACGPGATQFQPGDRVYALMWSWFGTHIRTPAGFAQKMKPSDTFEKMCTVPVTYCSAVYALVHLGRLKKGNKVLIQTATGGLGLAAIQVAKACGAEIYVTAGTPEKRAYLHESCGIPEHQVFSSREESDLNAMMAATGGKGFNVILSTSSGDMMHAAWRCIAPRGHFVDVARVDVVDHSMINMETFERNGTFSSFDLGIMMKQDPEFCSTLMEEVESMLRAGTIQPIDAVQSYDISKLDTALLSLSKAKHIGKFVVSYENPDSLVKMVAPVPRASFGPDAEYVLVGGLGGFGRSIIRWLAVRGARHLTIFRRSTTVDEEAQLMIDDLASKGVTVNLRQVDVTCMDQVKGTLADVSRVRPVKGILHAAMNPVDTAWDHLPYETWKFGLGSKVQGTINLHEASLALELPLDFFVLTGSIMAVAALPAHATYCTANAFQDAFARYRRSLGLPACTIGFGLITEITAVARRDMTIRTNKRHHLYGNGELETMQLLEAAFLDSPPEADGSLGWQSHDPLATSTLTAFWDPAKMTTAYVEGQEPVWHSNKKYSHILRALKNQLGASDRPLHSQAGKPAIVGAVDAAIKSGTKEEAVILVATAVVERIAGLLEIETESIDPSRGVAEYGVDSLIAVELRSWVVSMFDQSIPLLKLLDERNSITNLAETVVNGRAEAIAQSP